MSDFHALSTRVDNPSAMENCLETRRLRKSTSSASVSSALLVALAVILLGNPPLMLSQKPDQGLSRDETLRYINAQLSKYSEPGHETKCGHPDYEVKVTDSGRTLSVAQRHRDGCDVEAINIPMAMLEYNAAYFQKAPTGGVYLVGFACADDGKIRVKCYEDPDPMDERWSHNFWFLYYGPEEGAKRLAKALAHLVRISQDGLKKDLDANDPFAK